VFVVCNIQPFVPVISQLLVQIYVVFRVQLVSDSSRSAVRPVQPFVPFSRSPVQPFVTFSRSTVRPVQPFVPFNRSTRSIIYVYIMHFVQPFQGYEDERVGANRSSILCLQLKFLKFFILATQIE